MFEFEINPGNIKKADVVVGLASFNEEDNISYPTQQASLGLKKYFSNKKCVIINCDNNSPDDTKSAFLSTETEVPKIYITTPMDTLGKGYNFENLFRKTCDLGAEKLICLDADLLSITPEWIQYFGEPLNKGYDYVTPIYARHKYDGTITNNICYPMVYGLLGRNVRQPIGGDFALSGKLIKHLLLQPWHRTTEEYGIDIFLSMNAILGDFKVCQTSLGSKVHKPSAPKLGPMFLQVVKTAFLLILNNIDRWKNINKVQRTRKFGKKQLGRAQKLTIDREALGKKVKGGYKEHKRDIKRFLSIESYDQVEEAFDKKTYRITDDMWVKIVYDMLADYRETLYRTEIVEALRPLYFARTLTFMNDTWNMPSADAEKLVIKQAEKFFKNRDYLLSKLES
jgi:hypothetical protein